MTVRNFRNNQKRAYLLHNCVQIPLKERIGEYSYIDSLNTVKQDGVTVPVVTLEGAPSTHSKTAAYPGDDDADPGQERCY